ncbi:unnamed protein product [Polarella glacialis]|uniref:Secreted protein n=1 Tax=Polarella glacialis TaxID=89957 RepID=A0A813GM40_POLGL|nr:unnamed protein product [Polarella glacialis]CAE8631997.1 unnamed protein product [Polarella glacialis]CAE8646600.1 unnamed protein product [Polarella glacialis]
MLSLLGWLVLRFCGGVVGGPALAWLSELAQFPIGKLVSVQFVVTVDQLASAQSDLVEGNARHSFTWRPNLLVVYPCSHPSSINTSLPTWSFMLMHVDSW